MNFQQSLPSLLLGSGSGEVWRCSRTSFMGCVFWDHIQQSPEAESRGNDFLYASQVLVGCPRPQETTPPGCGQEGRRNLARVPGSRGPKRNQPGFSQLRDNQPKRQRWREIHIRRCPGLLIYSISSYLLKKCSFVHFTTSPFHIGPRHCV